MNTLERFLGRWKAEYDFKTYMTAACSLAATLFFAFYNGYLGIHHASLWYGTICIYYIMLTLLRGSIIAAARMIDRSKAQETARNKAFLAISFLLLILNISLIVPISIMVRQQKPISLTLVPAITMAAYTTYKVTMTSINLRKRKGIAGRSRPAAQDDQFYRCARIDPYAPKHIDHGLFKRGGSGYAAADGCHQRLGVGCGTIHIFKCYNQRDQADQSE